VTSYYLNNGNLQTNFDRPGFESGGARASLRLTNEAETLAAEKPAQLSTIVKWKNWAQICFGKLTMISIWKQRQQKRQQKRQPKEQEEGRRNV
jgi:hypothetical protein